MTLLVPDVGEKEALEMMLKEASPAAQTLKLYTNNKTPAESDDDTDYTVVVGFGYSNKSLARASWTVATVGGTTTADHVQQTFTFTSGPVTVFGYYVINTSSGVLMWAERFSVQVNVPAAGGDIKITPKIQLS